MAVPAAQFRVEFRCGPAIAVAIRCIWWAVAQKNQQRAKIATYWKVGGFVHCSLLADEATGGHPALASPKVPDALVTGSITPAGCWARSEVRVRLWDAFVGKTWAARVSRWCKLICVWLRTVFQTLFMKS
jgi:hypothetical protein